MRKTQNQNQKSIFNSTIDDCETEQKKQWQLSDFDFELPKNLIANQPRKERSKTPLLVYQNQQIVDAEFGDLADFLRCGDLLVFNQARVIKASLSAINSRNLAKIDFNLNQKISSKNNQGVLWSALAKPGKKIAVGDFLEISANMAEKFSAKIVKKDEDGMVYLEFYSENQIYDEEVFLQKIEKFGSIPLPPYIKRGSGNFNEEDEKNYQTIYAKTGNAVAAPTAGLHFDEGIFLKLQKKGIKTAFLNLDVGAGTFLPVRCNEIYAHKMHSENFAIDTIACAKINETRKSGGRIIAVGTTSLRALESAVNDRGVLVPQAKSTEIFIYPPYKFKIVDALITNFHLPKSTLLMLVAAFVGYEKMRQIYDHAISKQYRFFSYGDSSLVFP